jgi:hypothetical protein
MTGEQLAAFLGIPYSEAHIAALRKRPSLLPYLQWEVDGKVEHSYPRDLVRAWANARALRGKKRAVEP